MHHRSSNFSPIHLGHKMYTSNQLLLTNLFDEFDFVQITTPYPRIRIPARATGLFGSNSFWCIPFQYRFFCASPWIGQKESLPLCMKRDPLRRSFFSFYSIPLGNVYCGLYIRISFISRGQHALSFVYFLTTPLRSQNVHQQSVALDKSFHHNHALPEDSDTCQSDWSFWIEFILMHTMSV